MSTASALRPLVEDGIDGSWLVSERTSIRSLNNNTHLLQTSKSGTREATHRLGPESWWHRYVDDAFVIDFSRPTDTSDDEAIYCDRRRYGARCLRRAFR